MALFGRWFLQNLDISFFSLSFFEWNAVVVSCLFQILEIALTVLSISLFNYYF